MYPMKKDTFEVRFGLLGLPEELLVNCVFDLVQSLILISSSWSFQTLPDNDRGSWVYGRAIGLGCFQFLPKSVHLLQRRL